MGLKSGQEWAGLIVCKDDTGALSTPSVGPVGALYVNGTLNAASVTVSGSNPYKWVVTLPTLSPGDLVSMYMTATIDGVATAEVVAEDVVDTYRISDIEELVDDIGVAGAGLTAIPTIANVTTVASTTTIGSTGLTAIAAAVWNALTSGLTTVGSIGAYILNYLDAKVSTVGGGTTEGIAAAVWDYLTSAATTAGSLGALIVTKLGYLTSGTTVTVSSPLSASGNITTIQGDDYDADAGRQIDWDVSTTATVTGGTVSVVLSGVATYTGSVVDADTVRLELTAAETAAIPVGKRKYQVILTDTGGDVATLVEGTWTSNARVSE